MKKNKVENNNNIYILDKNNSKKENKQINIKLKTYSKKGIFNRFEVKFKSLTSINKKLNQLDKFKNNINSSSKKKPKKKSFEEDIALSEKLKKKLSKKSAKNSKEKKLLNTPEENIALAIELKKKRAEKLAKTSKEKNIALAIELKKRRAKKLAGIKSNRMKIVKETKKSPKENIALAKELKKKAEKLALTKKKNIILSKILHKKYKQKSLNNKKKQKKISKNPKKKKKVIKKKKHWKIEYTTKELMLLNIIRYKWRLFVIEDDWRERRIKDSIEHTDNKFYCSIWWPQRSKMLRYLRYKHRVIKRSKNKFFKHLNFFDIYKKKDIESIKYLRYLKVSTKLAKTSFRVFIKKKKSKNLRVWYNFFFFFTRFFNKKLATVKPNSGDIRDNYLLFLNNPIWHKKKPHLLKLFDIRLVYRARLKVYARTLSTRKSLWKRLILKRFFMGYYLIKQLSQLKNIIKTSKKLSGNKIFNFYFYLESRILPTCLRMCFFWNKRRGFNWINWGFMYVNGFLVRNFNYLVKYNSIIRIVVPTSIWRLWTMSKANRLNTLIYKKISFNTFEFGFNYYIGITLNLPRRLKDIVVLLIKRKKYWINLQTFSYLLNSFY